MPIERIPVVHKFGIISHSQRVELQNRLLKQTYQQNLASQKPQTTTRYPFEVSDDFIQRYNASETLEEQEQLEKAAYKMLERMKRRAGLKDGGIGSHVDLPIAWTELSQLAQCRGKMQEECLDILITSLDQVPLNHSHIPALFFLAETTLYWLRTDAINQPYLRTAEIKMLRTGQLVFMRLFYHHMTGQLQGREEFKNRLFTYLDGFAECQEAYSPYPNALLCVRYISAVGRMIIGDANLEVGEIKEGDVIEGTEKTISDHKEYDSKATTKYDDTHSSQSGAVSSSVHDLSPTLWHSLDVWRCVKQLGGGKFDALRALATCGQELSTESWVDGMCAMHVLTDSAKTNIQALKTLQSLATGAQVKATPLPAKPATLLQEDVKLRDGFFTHESSDTKGVQMMNKPPLSDICEKTESEANTSVDFGTTKESLSLRSHCLKGMGSKTTTKDDIRLKGDFTATSGTLTRTQTGTEFDTVPNTGWRAEAGTELPSGRASEASTVATYTNQVYPELFGLHGWQWEVSVTYTDLMADIALHGNTSTIQKVALLGSNKTVEEAYMHNISFTCPMKSAGLLDLVYFRAVQEAKDGGPNDWSWRVRYAAIQGLVKICRSTAGDKTKEGMRTVAWNILLRASSNEADSRVQEALKVGQVESNIENLINKHLTVPSSSIGAKIAAGLSVMYLPPLPPPVKQQTSEQKKTPPKFQVPPPKPSQKPALRTTIKDEVMLATALYEPPPDLQTRTSFNLKRIVEDQWRKDLQVQLEEDEEDRIKQLEETRKLKEEKEREIEAMRKEKLKNKYKGGAYQYKDLDCLKTQDRSVR